ncbi:hypothetical protein LPJ72_002060 [Coemansia sp. Benny D160-2]|nr:hypothetical protein LPJ72_002060 [Coemansia sp. Benny D160-2]
MSNDAGKGKRNATKKKKGFDIFHIPQDILADLELSAKLNRVAAYPQPKPQLENPSTPTTADDGSSLARTLSATRIAQPVCHTCGGVTFPEADQLRAHMRTEWHQTNMRRKAEWRRHLSSHDDGSSPGADYPWDPVSEADSATPAAAGAISAEATNSTADAPDDGDESDREEVDAQPYFWFTRRETAAEATASTATALGVHRKILVAHDNDRGAYVDGEKTLRRLIDMQATNGNSTSGCQYWALMCLNGGGHFGASIVDNRTGSVVAHKTIHRYTTRRKQGGSQSRDDNAKGRAAHSAGAQLRRYNEQKLAEEVRDIILNQWKDLLHQCARVLVRVPRANRKQFPLDWSDSRVRSIPIPVGRPTLSELRRVYSKLTAVKIRAVDLRKQSDDRDHQQAVSSDDDDESISQGDGDEIDDDALTLEPVPEPELVAFLQNVAAMMLDETTTSESIVHHLCEHLAEFLDALSDPALGLRYLESTASITAHRTPTLLHLASHLGRVSLIPFLLDNGDDPTVTNGHPPLYSAGKTAYEISKDRRTRDEFRVYRFENESCGDNEYAIDWRMARVPDPISRDRLKEKDERMREKGKTYKKKQRQRAKKSTQPTATPAPSASSSEEHELEKEADHAAAGSSRLPTLNPNPNPKPKPKSSGSSLLSASPPQKKHSKPSSAISIEDQRAIDRELRLQAVEQRRLQELQSNKN